MHSTRLRFALLGLALAVAIGGAFTAMPGWAQTPSPPAPMVTGSPLETPSPATAEPTTAAPSPTATINPTTPPSPTATVVPTAVPSPTTAPTPTQAPPPTIAPTPTPAPPPTATQTPGAGGILSGFPLSPQIVLLAGAVCGVALLLVLILVVFFLRRRRRLSKKPTTPLPSVKPSPPWLEARVSGKARPFPLQKDAVTIGRAPDNDLVISQDLPGWETVSRHHARLYRQGDRWIVEDLQSTNGVYVNGKRTGRNLLQDGWRLDIGGVTFIFHAGTGGAA